jgi:hypothetical protein
MLTGVLQPFPVVLDRSVLPLIQQRLSSSSAACHLAWKTIPQELGTHLDAISVESLWQCGLAQHPRLLPPANWFQGGNTLAELARLERIALGRASAQSLETI